MTYEEAKALTDLHMADPRPGDRFEEMLTYWVEVLAREGDWVITWDTTSRTVKATTLEEFRHRHIHKGATPSCWLLYYDDKAPLDDLPSGGAERAAWIASLIAERTAELTAASMAGAML